MSLLQRNPCSPAGDKYLGCSPTYSRQEVSMQDLLPPSLHPASTSSCQFVVHYSSELAFLCRRGELPPRASSPHWLLQVWTLAAWHKPALCLPPIALTHIYYSICPDRNSLWSVPVMFCSGSQLPLAQSCTFIWGQSECYLEKCVCTVCSGFLAGFVSVC